MEFSESTQNFIKTHLGDNVNTLRLKYSRKDNGNGDEPDIEFALIQIEARKKAAKKIASFLANPLFLFPDTLSAEQATNETLALFHARIISSASQILDLTAGLGIDDMTFALEGHHVTACELDKTKSEVLNHNSEILGLKQNLSVNNCNSIDFLIQTNRKFDVIFADPARRGSLGKRVHALSDCQPDIIEAMPLIMAHTDRFLVKASPLLDISHIRDTIKGLYHIYVVCLRGECKEVLIDIRNNCFFSGITVIDLDRDKELSRFEFDGVTNYPIAYAERTSAGDFSYLYEPNSGIMKTSAWGKIIELFPELRKADTNTHLFLSDTLYEDFPGRVTATSTLLDKKALKALRGAKCNIVVRNYPLTASEVAGKYSIIPGSDRFIYAFKYKGKPVITLGEDIRMLMRHQE